jgi:hypothetical protein
MAGMEIDELQIRRFWEFSSLQKYAAVPTNVTIGSVHLRKGPGTALTVNHAKGDGRDLHAPMGRVPAAHGPREQD